MTNKLNKAKRKAYLEMKKELQQLASKETDPVLKEIRTKIIKDFIKNKGFKEDYNYDPEGDFEW